MNFFEGRVQVTGGGRSLQWRGSPIPAPEWMQEGPALLGVRPEDLLPGSGPISLRVRVVEDLGADRFVYGDAAGVEVVYRASPDQKVPAPGEGVELGVRAGKAHWFASGHRVESGRVDHRPRGEEGQ